MTGCHRFSALSWCGRPCGIDTRQHGGNTMEARAKLFGHPIHQMLIVFPLGLLGMGVIFDIVFLSTESQIFSAVAYWMMIAGIAGGLLAAPFGFIDWLGIPRGTRARRIGAVH